MIEKNLPIQRVKFSNKINYIYILHEQNFKQLAHFHREFHSHEKNKRKEKKRREFLTTVSIN